MSFLASECSTGGTVNIYMSIEFRTHEFISHKVTNLALTLVPAPLTY